MDFFVHTRERTHKASPGKLKKLAASYVIAFDKLEDNKMYFYLLDTIDWYVLSEVTINNDGYVEL